MSELREDYPLVQFGDVVREVTEHDRTHQENGLEYYVGLDHLDPHSLKIKRWGLLSEGTTFTKRFRAGQVLFGRRRAYQRKAAVAHFDGICSGDILVFEAKRDRLLPELLPFLVHTDAFFDHALGTSSGSLSPRTKWREMATFKFRLPPIDKQKEMVELFQAIEDAIAATEALIGAAEDLKQALVRELLTKGIGHSEFKKTELGIVPCEWRVSSLSSVADLQVGFAFKSQCFIDQGATRLLRGENVGYGCPDWSETKYLSEETVPEFSEFLLNEGDIIIGMDRTFTGRGCKISEISKQDLPALLVQRVGRFVVKSCNSGFLKVILQSSRYQNLLMTSQKGMDIPHLSKSEILEPLIPVPSEHEQEQIAAVIESNSLQIQILQKHKVRLKKLKAQATNAFLSGQSYSRIAELAEEVLCV